jgi:hypothetical protein
MELERCSRSDILGMDNTEWTADEIAAATLETWQRLIDMVNGKRFCRHGVEIPGDCRDCGLVTRWLADGTTCGNR